LQRETARFYGIRVREFYALSGNEQADMLAHYETHCQIEAVMAAQAEKEREKSSS